MTDSDISALNSRYRASLRNDFGILPTQLCTHKSDVDFINRKHLRDLSSESATFSAVDRVFTNTSSLNIDRHCRLRKYLDLKGR